MRTRLKIAIYQEWSGRLQYHRSDCRKWGGKDADHKAREKTPTKVFKKLGVDETKANGSFQPRKE